MEIDKNSPQFNALPIPNFRFFNPPTMQSLAKDLRLVFSAPALFHIQHVYRTFEQRDPSVGELRFLSAFALLFHKMPGSSTLLSVEGKEAHTRMMRDVLHKRTELGEQTPPTLPQILDLLPRYLARSGIKPHTKALYAANEQELAALAKGKAPRLSLSLTHTAAALFEAEIPTDARPPQGVLMLLTPAEDGESYTVTGLGGFTGTKLVIPATYNGLSVHTL